MTASCVLCGGATEPVLQRDRIPVLQNVVYPTRALALDAAQAPFRLVICARCGFAFNDQFDDTKVVYDERYDNHVESPAFVQYYDQLVAMLIERFDLAFGTVYDVGCGKGTFLRRLCEAAPTVHGIGIDPSCEPGTFGNVTLIRARFAREHVSSDAKLVLVRHVAEHIADPVPFLRELGAACGNVPVFVEVPELGWIFEHGAFWDFCYEHVNYFTPASLRYALGRAGLRVVDQATSFGAQYQWAIGVSGGVGVEPDAAEALQLARAYSAREHGLLENVRGIVRESRLCALWGMATKGVVLATILGPDAFIGGIDSNPRKQGRYAPGSGLAIHAPEWLRQFDDPAVLLVNPNYLAEIEAQAATLGIRATFRAI